MVYKLLSFILIYILSIINFAIILLPLMFFVVPIVVFKTNLIDAQSIFSIVLFIFFVVSCLMNFIILLDFLFGFSSRKFLKNTQSYEKFKEYEILTNIFNEIKIVFNRPNVKLLISNSGSVNAFAVGNMKKQYIVLTQGLINKYLLKLKTTNNFLLAIRCIIGHEMSHLINKDYLPTLLLEINEYSTKFVSKVIYIFFRIFLVIFRIIPFFGKIFSYIIFSLYKMINFSLLFFYKYVIIPVYKLIYLKINRSKEFRCDMQSSLANGGLNMASALSMLDDGEYITLFSSHPKTKKRIDYIKNIKPISGTIKPAKGNTLINLIAFSFIILMPIILYYLIDFEHVRQNYKDVIETSKFQLYLMRLKINLFLRQ